MGEISASQVIQWIVTGIGLVGVWFRMQFKIERLEERLKEHVERDEKKHVDLDAQKDALWAWIQRHEREANDMREKFNRDLSEVRGGNLVINEKLIQMTGILLEMRDRLTRIENDNNGRRNS